MKQLVVLSGKGGTGKTFVSANLALQFKNTVAVDADVDAANLNIILNGKTIKKELFQAGDEAFIEQYLCKACGKCAGQCPYEAIRQQGSAYRIHHLLCEGCGICVDVCPELAIKLAAKTSGCWYHGVLDNGKEIFHAELYPGQDNSGKLVTLLRQKAEEHARNTAADLVLIDGPPGIACPAMAALTNTDYALFVTEPSASAVQDLERLISLSASFYLKKAVVINKAGLNKNKETEIAQLCIKNGIPILASIPFSKTVPLSLQQPGAYADRYSDRVSEALLGLYRSLKTELGTM